MGAAEEPRCPTAGSRAGEPPGAHGPPAAGEPQLPAPEELPITLLVDRFPERSETFVAAEARELAALGHRLHIEAAAPGDGGAPPDLPLAYREPSWRDLAWLLARHPLRCAADAAARRRWRRQEWVPPLRELAGVARRFARRGDRHLHAHFACDAGLTALRLGRLLGLPYSVTAHAYDVFAAPANLAEKLEHAAVAFTVCDYNARHLRALAPRARIETVLMGVDPLAFARRAPLPGGRTVLAVGRLVEKKGFAVLAQAARALPDVRVRVVGEGPLRAELEAQGTLELLGARTPDEVRALLEQADVLAMPCVVAADGDRDSMPVVVKEAMAMELMVVASDAVGLPECVMAPWGRLVAPGDPAALAAAIEAALALGAGERAAAGAAGRAWVLAHADVRTETAKVSAALRRAADGL